MYISKIKIWCLNVILQCVNIVETVHELGGGAVAEALGAPELAEVVGDVLQEDPDEEHAQQGRQPDVDCADAKQQQSNAFHH
jgi:hypothetical protein